MRSETHSGSGQPEIIEYPYQSSGLRFEDLVGLGEAARPHLERCSEDQRRQLEDLVYPDVFSEYDARFLSEHFARIGPFSDEFRHCEALWAKDEELHYLGFRSLYGALMGVSQTELDTRMAERRAQVDFEPLNELFQDELGIACLMAYDELATVAAYKANWKRYAWLGPEGYDFVRRVTLDEGQHYRNFRDVIRRVHGHRLGEVPRLVERIRRVEGVAYAATFVLDHDDDVWSERIFDEAAQTLCRQLAR